MQAMPAAGVVNLDPEVACWEGTTELIITGAAEVQLRAGIIGSPHD